MAWASSRGGWRSRNQTVACVLIMNDAAKYRRSRSDRISSHNNFRRGSGLVMRAEAILLLLLQLRSALAGQYDAVVCGQSGYDGPPDGLSCK